MKNKITVKLKWGLDETKVYFVNNGISLVESFILHDIYMIKNEVDVCKSSNLKVLSQAIIIRENIGSEHVKELVYKKEDKDEKGNVINSVKYSCPLIDVDKTYELITAIGYKECFRYEQECLSYRKGDKNILIECVEDLGLFIKLENNKSVEELIKELDELNIPYYENNYFINKANLMLDLMKKRRRK